jgi:hypothetical protein
MKMPSKILRMQLNGILKIITSKSSNEIKGNKNYYKRLKRLLKKEH